MQCQHPASVPIVPAQSLGQRGGLRDLCQQRACVYKQDSYEGARSCSVPGEVTGDGNELWLGECEVGLGWVMGNPLSLCSPACRDVGWGCKMVLQGPRGCRGCPGCAGALRRAGEPNLVLKMGEKDCLVSGLWMLLLPALSGGSSRAAKARTAALLLNL